MCNVTLVFPESSNRSSARRLVRIRYLEACLQRIARRLGWLNRDEAVRLTHFQRGTGKTFEEAAVEASRLKPAHLEVLIAIQLDPPEFLAKRLVQGGVLSDAEAAIELKAYYDAIGVRRPAAAMAMAR